MDIRGLSPRGAAGFAVVAGLALAVLPGCSSEEPAQPAGSPAASSEAPIRHGRAAGTGHRRAGPAPRPPRRWDATIVFAQPDPANTKLSTDRPDIVELTQGSDDGSALFNPGAVALAPGVAVVTIVTADGTTSTVTVTVSCAREPAAATRRWLLMTWSRALGC